MAPTLEAQAGTARGALASIITAARHELADSIRSRRAAVLLLLYIAGSVAATLIFVNLLQKVEVQLVESMGLTPDGTTGSVTETLWQSDMFRRIMLRLVGDRALAEKLILIPPLGMYYGWLSFTFAPLLVILMSSTRIAEEIWSGSVRFVLFRTSRASWLWGKVLGQAGQVLVALLLSAIGAWIVGWLKMDYFDPLATAQAMIVFAFKAWIYALAFLGLALGVSQLCASPNLAVAIGFVALLIIAVLTGLSEHYAGDGIRRIWDLVGLLLPSGHRRQLWHQDLAHQLPGTIYLLTLGGGYLAAGYTRFARRDL